VQRIRAKVIVAGGVAATLLAWAFVRAAQHGAASSRRASKPARAAAPAMDPRPAATEQATPKASAAANTVGAAASHCPQGMRLVQGSYCDTVEHDCSRWLDDQKLPFARCSEYAPPARCKGKREALRFCMDQHEYTPPGQTLPAHHQSFVSASKTCKAAGKRVCLEREWTLACEGEEMRPYPYGWRREPKCNQDRPDLYEPNSRRQVLSDLRAASGSHPECVSAFGIYDMAGNVDELVQRSGVGVAYPFRNALKGGWWMAGRNRCRPATTAHDDHYNDMQTGFRCCADAPLEPDRG
jgi:hypothetical protein